MTSTAANVAKDLNTLLAENKISPIMNSSTQSFIRSNITMFSENSKAFVNPNGWNTFFSIEDPDTNALLSKINTGGRNYSNLLNMTTLEKAQIVPKINLYKVTIDGDSRKQTNEVPISFPDSSKRNIEELISSRGQRGDDVAIKSFSFDFKNQNPFGAGRIVDCNLVLTMMSGESLVKNRGNGFTFSDLILRNNRLDDEKFDSDYYEIKANVGYELPPGDFNAGLRAELRNTQVSMSLILVDYDLSFQQNGVLQLSLQYRARIEQAIEKQMRYNIFKDEEISLDASIKPQIAQLEKDLLADDGMIKQSNKLITSYEAELAEKEEVVKTGYNTTVSGFGGEGQLPFTTTEKYQFTKRVFSLQGEERELTEQAIQVLQENVDQLKIGIPDKKNKINELNNRTLFIAAKNRVAKFNKLLTNMFNKGKVYRLVVAKEDLLLYGQAYKDISKKRQINIGKENPEWVTFDFQADSQAQEEEARRAAAEASLVSQIRDGKATGPVSFNLEAEFQRSAEDLADKKTNGSITKNVSEEALKNLDVSQYVGDAANATLKGHADSFSADRGSKIIYWFYYGDLLQEAFKINDVHVRMKEDQIVATLGSFAIDDPKNPGTKIEVNIADVPITLELFIDFFKANVIDPGRDVYPVSDFIRDTIQRLVVPAINQQTFGNPQKQTQSLKISSFDLPGVSSGDSVIEPISSGLLGTKQALPIVSGIFSDVQLYKARVELDRILDRFGNNSLLAKRKTSERFNYLVFYANSSNTTLDWDGNIARDAKRGVYHFYIGADRGLIKEINFRKSQRPGLAEMMAEKSMRAGNRRAELWRNFEADISMLGNSLLKPGCFLYINPTVAGLGNPGSKDSLSRQMGLGGYYFVLGVSNEITDSGWNTQVRAVWQSAPSLS